MKFAGEISTDPGVGAEERELAMVPRPCHVGEDRQNGNFVIVVPKDKRVVREKEEAEGDDDKPGDSRADNFRTRGARPGHSAISTPNAERPTPNLEFRNAGHFAFFSVVRTLAAKILINSSTSPNVARNSAGSVS